MNIISALTHWIDSLVNKKTTALLSPTIAIINESSVVKDSDVANVILALQTQCDRDFSPVWGSTAHLVQVPQHGAPPAGAWWLVLLDDSDVADALGYHDVTNQGLPLGKVFVKTTMDAGDSWTVCASHELLEMLGDPSISDCREVDDGNDVSFYATEVCDAVEADKYGYKIGGVLVSDFIYPNYFGNLGGGRYDFGGHITKPLQILDEGYLAVFTGGQWTTLGRQDNDSRRTKYSGRQVSTAHATQPEIAAN